LLGVNANGDILFGQSGAGATQLNELSDVSLSSPVDDNVLQFDGSEWVNRSDVELSSTSAYYLGDSGTDGTWRFVRDGDNLKIERRESNNYVTKTTITA